MELIKMDVETFVWKFVRKIDTNRSETKAFLALNSDYCIGVWLTGHELA